MPRKCFLKRLPQLVLVMYCCLASSRIMIIKEADHLSMIRPLLCFNIWLTVILT